MNKAALRRAVRARFPGAAERDRQSALLCAHLLAWPALQQAQSVGAYVPLDWEADVTPLCRAILASGRRLALPCVERDGRMTMRFAADISSLTRGRWGLPEPPEDAEEARSLPLLIVPLEAVDPFGTRLGKGGGYYDRLLADFTGISVGAAMDWQWVEKLPRERWDVPLDAVADAEGVHWINR